MWNGRPATVTRKHTVAGIVLGSGVSSPGGFYAKFCFFGFFGSWLCFVEESPGGLLRSYHPSTPSHSPSLPLSHPSTLPLAQPPTLPSFHPLPLRGRERGEGEERRGRRAGQASRWWPRPHVEGVVCSDMVIPLLPVLSSARNTARIQRNQTNQNFA